MPTTGERERLAALQELDILDTPPEERFDRIVRLAKRLFDVPIALISLIDEDRQWNKASVGGVPDQVPRHETVCDHTIRQDHALVVPDLLLDPRFERLPLVREQPGLRFYAGHPLSAAGQRVGSLCIVGTEPRELSAAEHEVLADLASWAEKELADQEELTHAGEVQRKLLPRHTPDLPGYTIAGSCVTARQVGGDFYDWFELDDGVQLELADVMGKGIAAAIIAAGVRAVLRGASRFNDLARAVTRSAASLEDDLAETSTFVTAFCARLDPGSGRLDYVDAGHGLAVILDSDGAYRRLSGGGLPLGAVPGETWRADSTTLDRGEWLVVVSDGWAELFDTPRQGLEAVRAVAVGCSDAPGLVERMARVADERVPTDDVTIVVLHRDGP
ncbi:MAG: PP2C family protein-serine/threonine phosphatase [Intrasporangium sp.]|uniref:PP2C family protein-serine/threonine phosphatase n=1 Tax=Intrasporangium sp. TaxID=1925024 RepID=UPI003F7E6C7A